MNIWWNHWFSTAYHLINLMRISQPDMYVIGSNSNPDSVYKLVCDEWYTEPVISDAEEYVAFCIDFCREHNIDVFVPRRNLTAIVRHRAEFDNIGTRLLANTDETSVALADDKIASYRYLQSEGLSDIVPEFYSCTNAAEFKAAVERLQSAGYRACYKLSVDEGAVTFHVIEKEKDHSIYKTSISRISYDDALQTAVGFSFKIPIIVMPYMDEPEISVDCLKTDTGLIAVPRYKLQGRVSEVRFDADVIELVIGVSELFNFYMPYNVQFRWLDGKPRLLELNPRMSGGLQLSWIATGINIPQLALYKLTGQKLSWTRPNFIGKKVTYIETPLIVE